MRITKDVHIFEYRDSSYFDTNSQFLFEGDHCPKTLHLENGIFYINEGMCRKATSIKCDSLVLREGHDFKKRKL